MRISPLPPHATLVELIDAIGEAGRAAIDAWEIPSPPDAAALLRLVEQHGRTVVLFHPTGTRLVAFVVQPGAPPQAVIASESVQELLDTTGELCHHLGGVVAARAVRGRLPPKSPEAIALELRRDEELQQAGPQLDHLSRQVYDALFSRLGDIVPDQEPLTVVPYRELAVVPLGLLHRPDGTSLTDHHPLSVLPSIASLASMTVRPVDKRRAVVVGDPRLPPQFGLDPLRGAAREARDVTRLLSGVGVSTTLLPGRKATEAALRAAVDGASIVHLACHATVREPAAESALFLTPTQDDDGRLFPSEVADLQLDGALVVLSACQSGSGRITADGVISLGRAFLRGGSRSVLMSLWRVEDEATAFLMKEFYKGITGRGAGLNGRSLDAAAATQRAQLLTRDRLTSRPTAWGPWVLVGDGGWRLD